MAFSPEPAHTHGLPSRTAVLMVNLGTPSAPTSPAVRRYLRQFLSDPRVVEIPRPLWWVILHGVVLPLRPRRSAAKYAAIWTDQGSPLMVHSQQQALLLRGYLGERGIDADVVLAMRYGEPSIEAALSTLAARSVERVLLLPMYPQYSATTTASAIDALNAALARRRNVPEVRWIRHFHDDLGYIEALAESVRRHWGRHGRAQDRGGKLVMSFHGVPKRVLKLGDPYHCECQKTARLLGEALKLSPEEYVVTFQSRFGRAEWLGPYTAPTLESLARAGATSVDVICPGFPADCLETLEEIGIEGRATFLAAGGRDFHLIPGLNDSPPFISALVDLCARHLQGWPVERSGAGQRTQQAEESGARARLQGAER